MLASDGQQAFEQISEAEQKNVHNRATDGKLALLNSFKHPIKKDKNGNNPATMLLQVLYKHLISLIQ